MATGEMDSYLTFVGRGLHHVAQEMMYQSAQEEQYLIEVEMLCPERVATSELAEILSNRHQLVGKSAKRRKVEESAILAATCRHAIGSLPPAPPPSECDGAVKGTPHVSLGYYNSQTLQASTGREELTWSIPGSFEGMVWLRITTDAPPGVVGKWRFLGPLLALAKFHGGTNHSASGEDIGLDLGEAKSLDEVSEQLAAVFTDSHTRGEEEAARDILKDAVDLWRRHAVDCWPHFLASPRSGIAEKASTQQPLTYRISCVRGSTEKQQYLFTRQELITACAEFLVPANGAAHGWKVNLKDYDVEVVLFLASECVALGINLRPYKRMGAADFSTCCKSASSSWPPDITPPYLSVLSLTQNTLVRLRPSTAQLLLHLANLKPADVVLDPCVGIGTIAMEAAAQGHVAIGGDLALTEHGLADIASDYSRKARKLLQRWWQDGLASGHGLLPQHMCCWDACQLPLRLATVDAVVSDLPFGQNCLSSSRLDQMLPLLMAELARVLVPTSGRMVLLCGAFLPVLQALKQTNEDGHNEDESTTDDTIWKLPCQATFPVNIGGLLAWIVQVERGSRAMTSAPLLKNYHGRVKKLVERRQRIALLQQGDASPGSRSKKKKPRLQQS